MLSYRINGPRVPAAQNLSGEIAGLKIDSGTSPGGNHANG